MAKVHGKSAKVLYAQFDHSNYYRTAEAAGDAGLSDQTCFGDGGTKTIPGLRGGALTVQGLFDGTTDAINERLNADFQAANAKIVTVAPSGSFAVGQPAWMCNARISNYSVTSPISDVVQTNAEFYPEDGIDFGIGLHALAAETSSTNGSSNDNAAATSNGAVAHLHVTAVSGSSPTNTVKVQHSTDDSVWVDLITFTQATAATSERGTATGTVNRYTRVTSTIGGSSPSFTYAVALARRN